MSFFKDTRTLMEIHKQLLTDIEACSNTLTGEDDDPDVISDLEAMCEHLDQIEEVAFLKTPVDCACFYKPF